MQRIARRKVFTVGKRVYRWEDVVLAAHLWGDWAQMEAQVREGIARLDALESSKAGFPEPAADELADAWRYERDLLSADDMRAWLAQRRLEMDEWLGFIRRSVARQRLGKPEMKILRAQKVSQSDVDAAIYAEAVCSGTLMTLAERLAGQAAVYERLASDRKTAPQARCTKADVRAELKALPPDIRKKGFLGRAPSTVLERAELLACVRLASQRFVNGVAAPAGLEREVEAHALEWTRLDCETVSFPAEGSAREAALLVREDGLTLSEAAAAAKSSVEQTRYVLDDLPSHLKDRLVGALPGDLVGPVRSDSGYLLVSVLDRTEPSAKDRSIKRRARERIVARTVQREADRRVRWHERV